MQFRNLFSAVGQWWKTCTNKISRSVLRRLSKMRLRKVRSEVIDLRDEAMQQRSKINQTLKLVRNVISTCDCGCISDGDKDRAVKKYFDEKGCRRAAAMTTATSFVEDMVLEDVHDKPDNDVDNYRSVINDGHIHKEGNGDEQMKKVRKCVACSRNSTVAHHLNVALLEMNEVVRCLNEDLDFINWLIQNNGQ